MKKYILYLAIPAILTSSGCGGGVKTNATNNGTEVSDSGGSCTVFIIEKDGYKFAVAVGYQKVAIAQIK